MKYGYNRLKYAEFEVTFLKETSIKCFQWLEQYWAAIQLTNAVTQSLDRA